MGISFKSSTKVIDPTELPLLDEDDWAEEVDCEATEELSEVGLEPTYSGQNLHLILFGSVCSSSDRQKPPI